MQLRTVMQNGQDQGHFPAVAAMRSVPLLPMFARLGHFSLRLKATSSSLHVLQIRTRRHGHTSAILQNIHRYFVCSRFLIVLYLLYCSLNLRECYCHYKLFIEFMSSRKREGTFVGFLFLIEALLEVIISRQGYSSFCFLQVSFFGPCRASL